MTIIASRCQKPSSSSVTTRGRRTVQRFTPCPIAARMAGRTTTAPSAAGPTTAIPASANERRKYGSKTSSATRLAATVMAENSTVRPAAIEPKITTSRIAVIGKAITSAVTRSSSMTSPRPAKASRSGGGELLRGDSELGSSTPPDSRRDLTSPPTAPARAASSRASTTMVQRWRTIVDRAVGSDGSGVAGNPRRGGHGRNRALSPNSCHR